MKFEITHFLCTTRNVKKKMCQKKADYQSVMQNKRKYFSQLLVYSKPRAYLCTAFEITLLESVVLTLF
jgi:hypothetical protein